MHCWHARAHRDTRVITAIVWVPARIPRSGIEHWNEEAELFEWTATADNILDKLAMLDRSYKKLVANNLK